MLLLCTGHCWKLSRNTLKQGEVGFHFFIYNIHRSSKILAFISIQITFNLVAVLYMLFHSTKLYINESMAYLSLKLLKETFSIIISQTLCLNNLQTSSYACNYNVKLSSIATIQHTKSTRNVCSSSALGIKGHRTTH